jgi:hypothetical protein
VIVDLGHLRYNTGERIVFTMEDDFGAAIDLTGCTLIAMPVKRVDNDLAVSWSGAIYGTSTNGQVVFAFIDAAFAAPRLGDQQSYVGRVQWVPSGGGATRYARERVKFTLVPE